VDSESEDFGTVIDNTRIFIDQFALLASYDNVSLNNSVFDVSEVFHDFLPLIERRVLVSELVDKVEVALRLVFKKRLLHEVLSLPMEKCCTQGQTKPSLIDHFRKVLELRLRFHGAKKEHTEQKRR
jgi:hypothetical protein